MIQNQEQKEGIILCQHQQYTFGLCHHNLGKHVMSCISAIQAEPITLNYSEGIKWLTLFKTSPNLEKLSGSCFEECEEW